MGFYNKLHGEYEHSFNVGDRIITKNKEILYVGDDWEELHYWKGSNATKEHIITTCGRVFNINEIEIYAN